MTPTRRFAPLLLRIWNKLGLAPTAGRDFCLRTPGLAGWAERRWSLQLPAAQQSNTPKAACRQQFAGWHAEDLTPRLHFYGRGGWRTLVPEPSYSPPAQEGTLRLASRAFFETQDAETGRKALESALAEPGTSLLLYAPNRFAHRGSEFAWVPTWEELTALARSVPDARVTDFNPGFDRNGFFHVVIERNGEIAPKPLLTGAGHYFYLNVGRSRLIGHSAQVLSATGLRALQAVASPVTEHSFYAGVPEDAVVAAGDVTMGHYGVWVTGAREAGALTILYGPGDRFRPERHDALFFEAIQARGDFAAQYEAAHMVIMQAGGRWRMTDPYPHPGLCRWIDLPVSAAVFPRTKTEIAPPGRRVFCFVGLYDDYQKGLDIARALCRRCPDLQFIAVGCKPIGEPNCREYTGLDNRRPAFRHLVAQADFIVSPARDDAQPGTIAECGSVGLLPIISETTGYVLSFPRRLQVDDLGQCASVLRAAQAASPEEVKGWQQLNAQYIEQFHRPAGCDALLQAYLAEAQVRLSE